MTAPAMGRGLSHTQNQDFFIAAKIPRQTPLKMPKNLHELDLGVAWLAVA